MLSQKAYTYIKNELHALHTDLTYSRSLFNNKNVSFERRAEAQKTARDCEAKISALNDLLSQFPVNINRAEVETNSTLKAQLFATESKFLGINNHAEFPNC